jgi:ketosteroid isomerase-like protein
MKLFIAPFAALGILFGTTANAAETPETILIRSALDSQKFGMRIGNAELVLSAYAEDFVAYDGNSTADPRGWYVLFEDYDTFAQNMTADLQTHRYELERTVPFIQVLEKKAMVTTVDSGLVVDRQSGASKKLKSQSFWIFTKFEEEDKWLATALVQNLGDTTAGPRRSSDNHAEIIDVLQREQEGWKSGSASTIAGLFSEDFIGYGGYDTYKPATWKIIFGGTEDLEKWLDRRLAHTTYSLNRQVVYTNVGAKGREALALTKEEVSVAHNSGPAKHSRQRYVLWTMSKSSGSWKVTNMLFDLGLSN